MRTQSGASAIFERHHLRVYRYLRRMTGDPAFAEDLTQEVFVRVCAGLTRYDERDREASWVFRIARNLLHDSRRQERARSTVDASEVAELLPSRARLTLGHDLEQALLRIPEEEREALLLREHGGFGYEEIAVLTGATAAAVRSRIYRARKSMRSQWATSGAGHARR